MAPPDDGSDKSSSSKKDEAQEKGLNFKSSLIGLIGSCATKQPSISSAISSHSSNESKNMKPKMSAKSTAAGTTNDNMVKVNVYGLTEVNRITKYFGLGVYHSGVECYGVEWAFGGYPKPVPSIYRMKKPRNLASLSDIDGRFHFVETLEMGKTKFTYEEVKKILTNLGRKEWIGTNYHLLFRNCNHFSSLLCQILCNKTLPPWVNRVATVFSKLPFLVKMLPKEFFTPVVLHEQLKVEQTQKYQLSKVNAQQKEAHEEQQQQITSEVIVKEVAEQNDKEQSDSSRVRRLDSFPTVIKSVPLDPVEDVDAFKHVNLDEKPAKTIDDEKLKLENEHEQSKYIDCLEDESDEIR